MSDLSAYSVANGYISAPIGTDPDSLTQAALLAIAAQFPGWVPNEGALEVAVIEQMIAAFAETAIVASQVSQAIFASFGTLVGIQQEQGSAATILTTWTMVDTSGYTVPAGTVVAFSVLGNQVVLFQTVGSFTVASGGNTATNVELVAQAIGTAGNGLGPSTPCAPYTQLSFVSSVVATSTSAGGTNPETLTTYINRLSYELQLLGPRPILPADYAALSATVAGVYRATAINLLMPGRVISATLNTTTTLVDPGRTISSTGGTTTGSNVLTDSADSFTLGDIGRPISGTGIPSNTIIGAFVSTGSVTMVIAGNGSPSYATATGGTVTVTVGGSFTAADVGRSVTGTDVPSNTTISAYTDAGHVTMSHAATGSVTENVTLGDLTGQERAVAISAVDASGNALTSPIIGALLSYLQAQREVNCVVGYVAPRVTEIDVSFSGLAAPGYNPASVQGAAVALLTGYLSRAYWGGGAATPPVWDPTQTTVRYLIVAGVLATTPGLLLTDLQICAHGGSLGTSDVALPGDAPLADVGTLTGIVTGV